MRNETVAQVGPFRVILMDSISLIGPHDVGAVIVCGSHGGAISGAFARKHPPALVLFNDAGVGKRRAGIASLEVLQRSGIPAAAISYVSARIGDATDAWDNGAVSFCNDLARKLGLSPGASIQAAVATFAQPVAGQRPET
jgi:hypothetical protein